MNELPSGTPLWVVTAEFTDRDDAIAAMDLLREMGVLSQLASRSINEPYNAPARDWRAGKLILSGFADASRTYDLDHFRALLEEHGYKATTASSVLVKLVQQGDLERVASGVYRLPKKTD